MNIKNNDKIQAVRRVGQYKKSKKDPTIYIKSKISMKFLLYKSQTSNQYTRYRFKSHQLNSC